MHDCITRFKMMSSRMCTKIFFFFCEGWEIYLTPAILLWRSSLIPLCFNASKHMNFMTLCSWLNSCSIKMCPDTRKHCLTNCIFSTIVFPAITNNIIPLTILNSLSLVYGAGFFKTPSADKSASVKSLHTFGVYALGSICIVNQNSVISSFEPKFWTD